MAVDNLYEASPLIVARLKSQVTDLKTVGSASLLNSIEDIIAQCDAAYVIPDEGDVTSKASSSIAMGQNWVVTVTVQHDIDPLDVNTFEKKAGQLCGKVIQALHGHTLSNQFKPMQFVGNSKPFYGYGYAEFPLLFNVTFAIKGA